MLFFCKNNDVGSMCSLEKKKKDGKKIWVFILKNHMMGMTVVNEACTICSTAGDYKY